MTAPSQTDQARPDRITAETFAERALARGGVRFTVIGPTTVRAVTHLDLPPDAVERALAAAHAALVS